MTKTMGCDVFRWVYEDNIWFRGYLYNEELEALFIKVKQCNSLKDFGILVKELDGCFAIVYEKSDSIKWIAADLARSFPVFLNQKTGEMSESADMLRISANIERECVDEVRLGEMLASTNVQVGHTVYKDIISCAPGQVMEFREGSIDRQYYYKHLSLQISKQNPPEKQEFQKLVDIVFEKLVKGIGGRTVLLPLSGGYDSRFIACMLKEKGYESVICYTYGCEKDYEVQYSKKVAEALGYEWHFVPYTRKRWKWFWSDNNELVEEYFKESHNHVSLPHIQDFIALYELSRKKVVPPDAVVITGFCADLPAGSFVKEKKDKAYTDKQELIEQIFEENFSNIILKKSIANQIQINIESFLDDMIEEHFTHFNYEDSVKVYDAWFTCHRPAHWVVNSNRVYEYWGYEWRMPFWDKDFLSFWYQLSSASRYDCKFYKEFLFSELFEKYNIAFIKPTYDMVLKSSKSSRKKVILKSIKKCLIYLTVKTGILFFNRYNINNYNIAATYVYKKIKNRKFISYMWSIHQIEMMWWCEKMYGEKCINRIKM